MRHLPHTCAALTAALLLAGAPAAHAAGPPVLNITEHVDETSVVEDSHPCTGQLARITVHETGTIHLAVQPDGNVHFTGTLHATFTADALPADGVADATGSYVVWFGGNGLLLEEGGATGKAQTAFTWNGRGTNADGSAFRWHLNGNSVYDAEGSPKLDVFHEHVRCD